MTEKLPNAKVCLRLIPGRIRQRAAEWHYKYTQPGKKDRQEAGHQTHARTWKPSPLLEISWGVMSRRDPGKMRVS